MVLVTTVGVISVVGGVHAWLWPQARRDRVVRDFALKRGMVLDTEAALLAERLLVATRRGRFVGAELGIVAVGGAWWASRTLALDVSLGLAFVAGFALYQAIPQVTATLGAALAMRHAAPETGDRRVAHLPVPSLGDFLPPLMRWSPVALLAVSGVAVGVAVITWPVPIPAGYSIGRRGLAAAWVVGLVAVAAAELAARVVVRMPRPATSAAALAVQDEITGDLATVIIVGALGPGLLLGLVASAVAPAAAVIGGWVVIVPALAEHRRRRRVRDRLWGMTVAHGSTVAPAGAREQAP